MVSLEAGKTLHLLWVTYCETSQTYINFIELLLEFNDDEKRLFFKFVTGAERLPFGGTNLILSSINDHDTSFAS